MIRRLAWMAAILFVIAILWAFAYGPLFPWSAIQPGYRTVRFSRAALTLPSGVPLDPAPAGVDRLVAEAEAFHGMRAPSRLRIMECATGWISSASSPSSPAGESEPSPWTAEA